VSALPPALSTALNALTANPLRSVLSTLGVVIGAGALVAVLSVGDGVERYARRLIERSGVTSITVAPQSGERIDGVFASFGDQQVEFAAADIDSVRTVVPATADILLSASNTLLTPIAPEGERRGLFVNGLLATRIPATLSAQLAHGRMPTPAELSSGALVAVVNDTLARILTGDTLPAGAVGKRLTLRDRELEVIGVLGDPPIELPISFLQVTVPLDVMQELSGRNRPILPRMEITVAEASEVDSTRAALTRYVEGREGWTGKVGVSARGPEQLEQLEQGMLVLRLAMGAFASISLIVGGIGIMNVLLASVAERTREIGVRKAMGARQRDILWQFLAESVAITSVGSLLGLVVGVLMASVVTWVMRSQTRAEVYAAVTPGTLLTSAAIAVVIGVVFGLVPALRASRLSPIDAIRQES
jgi:putative ABC transport system permease protein